MDYKKELIKRVIFIMENSMYLIEPQNTLNLLNLYLELEKNNKELLQDLEVLLLSDDDISNNNLYQEVKKRKNNKEYLLKLKENKDNIIDPFTLLSLVRKYVIRENIGNKEILKKIDTLDEYFRIIRYKNNKYTYISGANLEPNDIKNHIEIKSGVIRNGIKKEDKINYSKIYHYDFINYISNIDNHHKDNLSILTEEEKQKIYLLFHDEIPWNAKEVCTKSNLFFSENYCNQEFYLNEDEIFYYHDNYYMMCPNCYNIVIVDSNKLSNSIKQRIRKRNNQDSYYLRNVLYKREYLINEKKKILMKK